MRKAYTGYIYWCQQLVGDHLSIRHSYLYNDTEILCHAGKRLCKLCVLHDDGLAEMLDALCLQAGAPELKVVPGWIMHMLASCWLAS